MPRSYPPEHEGTRARGHAGPAEKVAAAARADRALGFSFTDGLNVSNSIADTSSMKSYRTVRDRAGRFYAHPFSSRGLGRPSALPPVAARPQPRVCLP